jgi:hypothetical protein
MASDVDIVNNALTKLGEQAILGFTDDSDPGRLANRTFANIRDAMLRENPWNFATKRAQLAAEVTGPVYEFANSYPLPTDFIRLIEIDNPNRFPYRLEMGRILCDLASPINIRYVFQVTDADAMDPGFREALSARLAAEWAEALSATNTVTQQMFQLARQKLAVALAIDGQEDDQRSLQSTSFIDARY